MMIFKFACGIRTTLMDSYAVSYFTFFYLNIWMVECLSFFPFPQCTLKKGLSLKFKYLFLSTSWAFSLDIEAVIKTHSYHLTYILML
ncbi:MAG: hypothetical protein DRO01_00330 [Thermoproteota archaeon]|nr:MAG: hypothetical protein DRO01_00330 [Candidatus Korarchaeota archaeon]